MENKYEQNKEQNRNLFGNTTGNIFEQPGGVLNGINELLMRAGMLGKQNNTNDSGKFSPNANHMDPMSLMNNIASLASEFLSSGSMKPDDDFFNMGGNSVQAIELASRLLQDLGINLSVNDLFADARPRSIAERWLKQMGVDMNNIVTTQFTNQPVQTIVPQATSTMNVPVVKDTHLDKFDEELQRIQKNDIQQIQQDIHLADTLPWVEAPKLVKPKSVLLTGTTGFLGSHVLFDLLRRSNVRIVCLVRGKDDQDAEQHLAQELKKRDFLWSNEVKRRVSVVAGDLRKPKFDWDDTRWNTLAEDIDSIVNVAADVDFVRSYNSLRPTNTLSIVTLAEFAVFQRIKPIHHVSSLAVFNENGISSIGEDDPLAKIDRLFAGYDKSKWAAEAILRRAREHGLCVTLLRPGAISGNTQSGVYNPFDLSSGLIGAFQALRMVPEFKYMNVAPVDWISRMITEIVIDPEAWGYNYHLIGKPVSLRQQIREFTVIGMAMKIISFKEWRLHFLNRMNKNPVPNLGFLALALNNKSATKLLEAVLNWPAGTADRIEAFIEKRKLPERPDNNGISQMNTMDRLDRDNRAILPKRGDKPYLLFRETMKGSLGRIHTDISNMPIQKRTACRFNFILSVASFYQLFKDRRLDIHGKVHCALLHKSPLVVEQGDLWIRPNAGVSLKHGFGHALLRYKLLLRDADGILWELEGYKTARPGFNLWEQVRTLDIKVGKSGKKAEFQGRMVVPENTYVKEQVEGLEVNPDVPEHEQYTAKIIWMTWFGAQIARGFMDPFMRVVGGVLDTFRTIKDKGEE